jgi:hypothetical protein
MSAAAARNAPLSAQFAWQRTLAYRQASRTPQAAAPWRARFEALAARSLNEYRQTVPGASKLRNPAAMHGIFRDLQNARVARNDMQVKAKAAELLVITDYLRRPEVAAVRVVPSSSTSRTPDLYVTYRGGRRPERVEIRTLTGNRRGWRPSPAVPIARVPEVQRLIEALVGKLRHGQLDVPLPGMRTGGVIVLRLTAPPGQADAMAHEVMKNLAGRLADATQLHRVEFHANGRWITFTRRGNRYVARAASSAPEGRQPARRRAPATALRRGARRR